MSPDVRSLPAIAREIGEAWRLALPPLLPWLAAAVALTIALGAAARHWPRLTDAARRARLSSLGLAAALALGLHFAWSYRAVFDDAFISFRYADNLLHGNGLVWNVGERVEGYTNFLWTMLVAGLSLLTRRELPLAAFFACLYAFAANLTIVWLIGRRLCVERPGQFHAPLAVLWLGAQYTFTSYATSGLETMYASLVVDLGVYFVVAVPGAAGAAAAGGALIAATLTRPDHGLFFATMGLALAWRGLARIRRPRDGEARRAARGAVGRELLAFGAPALAYAAYLVWKLWYYGDIVPNTFYAKSVEAGYWRQGVVYLLASGGSAQLMAIAPLFAWWLVFDRRPQTADLRRFAGLAVPLWLLYVVRLGGDFMIGRFLVVIMPLMLLGVECGIHHWARRGTARPSWRAIAAAALVVASLHGVAVISPGKQRWYMADEGTYYRVRRLFPVVIGHGAYDNGQRFRREISPTRLRLPIATSGVGMVGYYSRLPVVDNAGLNDRVIGRKRLKLRGRPGHEKSPSATYLDARGVVFVRWPFVGEEKDYAWFSLGGRRLSGWKLYRYDMGVMARLAEEAPGLQFPRFDRFLDRDKRNLAAMRPIEVARLLANYDHYYFSVTADPKRRQRFVDRFVRLWDFEDGCVPADADATGAFHDAILSPAREGRYNVEGHQGETLIATRARGDQGVLHLPPFTVEGDEIGFLLGGANDLGRVAAVLFVEGREIRRWTGHDDDKLFWVVHNMRRFKGKQAEIVLLDASNRGRLYFDMFWEGVAAAKPAAQPGG